MSNEIRDWKSRQGTESGSLNATSQCLSMEAAFIRTMSEMSQMNECCLKGHSYDFLEEYVSMPIRVK